MSQDSLENFQKLCFQDHNSKISFSEKFKGYQLYSETFLKSAKEALLDVNYVHPSIVLEELLDDKGFHQVLSTCYPNSPQKQMDVIYYLIAADVGGKVLTGASLVATGAVLSRIGFSLAARYGINLVRVRMAMVSVYVLNIVYTKYQKYQKLFHPSKQLKASIDIQMPQAFLDINNQVDVFKSLAKEYPQDLEIQHQLQVLLDLQIKLKKDLTNS